MPQNDLHQDPNHPHNLNQLGDIVNRIRTILNAPGNEMANFSLRKEDLSSTDSLIEQQLQNLLQETETLKNESETDNHTPQLRVFSDA